MTNKTSPTPTSDGTVRVPIVSIQFRLRAALAKIVPLAPPTPKLQLIQGGASFAVPSMSFRIPNTKVRFAAVHPGNLVPPMRSPSKASSPSSEVLRCVPGSSKLAAPVLPVSKRAVSAGQSSSSARISPPGCTRRPQLAASGGRPIPGVNSTFPTEVATRKSAIFLVTISEDASLSATNVFTRSDRDA